jgi:hypothetical protein
VVLEEELGQLVQLLLPFLLEQAVLVHLIETHLPQEDLERREVLVQTHPLLAVVLGEEVGRLLQFVQNQ